MSAKSAEWYRKTYRDASMAFDVAVADTGTATRIAAKTGHTIFVQRILVSVLTDAAQSITFQDNAGTPVLIAKTKASPGLGPIAFEFGARGTPLTVAQALQSVLSGAGLVARVEIEAYWRQTSALSTADAASA